MIADRVVAGTVQHHQVGDAQQRNQHEQRLGRLAILLRLGRVGRPQLGDQHLVGWVADDNNDIKVNLYWL